MGKYPSGSGSGARGTGESTVRKGHLNEENLGTRKTERDTERGVKLAENKPRSQRNRVGQIVSRWIGVRAV